MKYIILLESKWLQILMRHDDDPTRYKIILTYSFAKNIRIRELEQASYSNINISMFSSLGGGISVLETDDVYDYIEYFLL